MSLHDLTCLHGMGVWHWAADLWWIREIILVTPFSWLKGKIKNFAKN